MLETNREGEYLNVIHNGDLIVSISEEHNEIVVYTTDRDDPIAVHELAPE